MRSMDAREHLYQTPLMVFSSQRSYSECELLAISMSSNNNVKIKSQGHISENFIKTFIYTVDFQRQHQIIVTVLQS